jgi:hypothetical protein
MVEEMLATSKAVGTENLMNILKNYARLDNSKAKS